MTDEAAVFASTDSDGSHNDQAFERIERDIIANDEKQSVIVWVVCGLVGVLFMALVMVVMTVVRKKDRIPENFYNSPPFHDYVYY